MRSALLKRLLSLFFVLSFPVVVSAQQSQPPQSFNAWLNERIQSVVSAKLDLRENTRQTETPAMSANTTSLVDQSSVSALFGLALNLAGLSATSNDMMEATSVAITTSAYSLYAAAKGADPLNPAFYNKNAAWRNLSVTLGFDNEMMNGGTATERTKLIGFKYLIVNRREPGKHPNELQRIQQDLAKAAGNFGKLSDRIIAYIFKQSAVSNNLIKPGFQAALQVQKQQASTRGDTAVAARIDTLLPQNVDVLFVFGPDNLPTSDWTFEERQYFVDFQNQYLLGPGLQQLLSVLGQQEVEKMEQIIEQAIDPFVAVQEVSQTAIEKIRKAPQFSLSFLTKQRGRGADDYMTQAIFDYGLQTRINLTVNGAFEYRDSKAIGADLRGAKFAAQLAFQLTPEKKLAGRKPLNFSLAAESNWMSGMDSIYKAQTKLNIPIADGIDFPISLTFANRTGLIAERDVRGQFGFTFDLARLTQAFTGRIR
jgi:hypothetical protein